MWRRSRPGLFCSRAIVRRGHLTAIDGGTLECPRVTLQGPRVMQRHWGKLQSAVSRAAVAIVFSCEDRRRFLNAGPQVATARSRPKE